MDDSARKHKRTDNESNRKRQKHKLRISTDPTDRKREEQQRKPNRNNRPKQYKVPSSTTLYDLPLEILDIILQKSYLHWILNLTEKHRNEEVISSLTSVDVCFYQRITRQRYKNTIWRYLKDFYVKTKKKSAIIRNNRSYLLENVQPNDEFIDTLLSLKGITEEQRHFFQRGRSMQDKNAKLLRIVRSFDVNKFSYFINCLRQTNQAAIARIVENGGVVIKGKVKNSRATRSESMYPRRLHQTISDLRSRIKPRSYQTDKFISQLKEKGIEIVNSQLDRQTVVIWIWCQSQAALQHIQWLYESNQLRDILFHFANIQVIQSPASENIQPQVINIDSSQFEKTVVVCPISVNLPERIEVGRKQEVYGVTKLRNGIYVLCRSDSPRPNVFCVFRDQNPYRLQKRINVKEIKFPEDLASSEKENCLYVAERKEKCVWKIKRDTGDQHKIIKWLTIDYKPSSLSVSSDGQLLMVIWKSSILMIYGSDAELLRSIQLPGDIVHPRHAVETSVGNFIILHQWMGDEEGESWSSETVGENMWAISEVTRDGQVVIRRFVLSNETQKLNNYPKYLSLDSDDRVFVADYWHDRLILLDSDLKWNRNLCPSREEEEEKENRFPWSMCYDEGEKQLIVGELKTVNVYTLSQN